MNKAILFNFLVDKENRKIKVERSFEAPVDLVWAAWTEANILDQWWAPKPWKTRTKTMDFREGGYWLYAMLGPNNEEHWAKFEYLSIQKETSFTGYDEFCDADGNVNTAMPKNKWQNDFVDKGEQTVVNVDIFFNSLEDLETLMKMGFKEGFTMALENLDQYLSAPSK